MLTCSSWLQTSVCSKALGFLKRKGWTRILLIRCHRRVSFLLLKDDGCLYYVKWRVFFFFFNFHVSPDTLYKRSEVADSIWINKLPPFFVLFCFKKSKDKQRLFQLISVRRMKWWGCSASLSLGTHSNTKLNLSTSIPNLNIWKRTKCEAS